MQVVAYKIITDQSKNSISFSKNYRIFSTGEPVQKAVEITGFDEDLTLGSANSGYIIRKLRYSNDRANWSLWYNFTPDDLTNLTDLEFGQKSVFFEVKYEYDDSTYEALSTELKINEVKIRVKSAQPQADLFTPSVFCSDERCPAIIAERESTFRPYEVGTATGIAKELSLQTNKIFGHEVVYFKTEPDRDGADFIFKEWTLFKTTERKCIKIMVPDNKFPDNKPNFTEFGVDFEVPFEIHIDHSYFQMIFGKGSQPRKRDYLFFPLVNRMYEIQGSYLYRGFMMEPIYWKIQLTKFHPNIDMLMKAADRTFLDNIITSSEELFGAEAKVQTTDALDKQQFSTISTRFDESRRTIHPDIKNKILDITFNYAPLIEYYYDLSAINHKINSYTLVSNALPTTQEFSPDNEIYAYEDSEIFKTWRQNQLVTGDINVADLNANKARIKMNGPKDSFGAKGKYVIVEGYKTLGFKTGEKRPILETTTGSGIVNFKQAENAIVYKKSASTVETPNMTFAALINFNRGSQDVTIFRGYDDYDQKGLIIQAIVQDLSGTPNLSIKITINSQEYTYSAGNIEYFRWYPLIIPISSEFGQFEINLYQLRQDPANIKNFNKLETVYQSNVIKPGAFSFETTATWCVPSANYLIANIRLFNTMIQSEDHEFVVSQLFIRDESTLSIIDNARPRLNVPFIAINR